MRRDGRIGRLPSGAIIYSLLKAVEGVRARLQRLRAAHGAVSRGGAAWHTVRARSAGARGVKGGPRRRAAERQLHAPR